MSLIEAEMTHMKETALADRALLVEVRKAVQDNRESNIKVTAYAVAIIGTIQIILATLKYF